MSQDPEILIAEFTQAIDTWIDSLQAYDFGKICAKPSADGWSLGQVCMHLIENTGYFMEQVRICASSGEHVAEVMSDAATAMFARNSFPDEQLEGPPENALTPQPAGKEELIGELVRLKKEVEDTGALMTRGGCNGKSRHPGLGYFSASEWFRFAGMHFRHHFRQRKRIEAFLGSSVH